jgi:hypothetical protein
MSNSIFEKRYRHLLKAGDNGCMIWVGNCTNNGYGRINVNNDNGTRSTKLVHILAWELENPGVTRENLNIIHLCGEKLCCNIEHLAPMPTNRRPKDLKTGMSQRQFRFRYDKYINKDEFTGCWNWRGRKTVDGYSRVTVARDDGARVTTYMHIVAFEVWNPDVSRVGFDVSHICHNNSCCNPDHLILATHKQNMAMNTVRD